MPFTLTVRGPVLYVSWRGFTLDDLREVTSSIGELRRRSGRPVAYVSRLPASGHVFADEDQRVLIDFLLTILPDCMAIHHIVEGEGFVRSARLATVTNMARATPRPRDFHTHATLDEAVRVLAASYGVDLSDVAARAASRVPPPPEATPVKPDGAGVVRSRTGGDRG